MFHWVNKLVCKLFGHDNASQKGEVCHICNKELVWRG